jgi:hypothetical protein
MTVAAAVGDFGWEGRELSRVGFGLWWTWSVACGTSGGGVAACGERRRCSDGEG